MTPRFDTVARERREALRLRSGQALRNDKSDYSFATFLGDRPALFSVAVVEPVSPDDDLAPDLREELRTLETQLGREARRRDAVLAGEEPDRVHLIAADHR